MNRYHFLKIRLFIVFSRDFKISIISFVSCMIRITDDTLFVFECFCINFDTNHF